MSTDWLERLQRQGDSLTKTERLLVAFINDHPDRASSLPQLELAREAGVSKPVVISCFRRLGFEDYRSFQSSVELFFETQIDALNASRRVQERVDNLEELIEEARAVDVRSLERFSASLDSSKLALIADKCMGARTIYCSGEGTGHYPADFVASRLRRYGLQTLLVGEQRSHAPDSLHPLGSEDILLLFHYSDSDDWLWPILELARCRSAWTLLASGTIHPDYVAGVSSFVHVPRGELHFKNSVAIPMHFANLILLSCEVEYRSRAGEQLAAFEDTRRLWRASGNNAERQGGLHV